MNAEFLIARRYLFSRKSVSLISTLTSISILGVTIGTALLIIILSVFNGFYDLIQSLLLSYDPDIRIESKRHSNFPMPDSLVSELRDLPEVRFVSPYLEGKCLISQIREDQTVVTVRGVIPKHFYPLVGETSVLSEGQFNVGIQTGKAGAVISGSFARESTLYLDESFRLFSADGIRRSLTQLSGPRIVPFQINGIFDMKDIVDIPLAIVDLRVAQRLFYAPNRISGIDLKLRSHEEAEAVKARLLPLIGEEFTIKTWYDLQKNLYDVMKLEKWASYAILMIIIFVAVLNIIGSLTMIVLQKRRDIGILASLGLSKKRITRIFFLQGLYVGLIGCGVGGGIGIGISYLQEKYQFVKLMGSDSFIIDAYPIAVHWPDIAIVLAGSLTLCLIASQFPARQAAQIEPVQALRYE